MVIYWAMFLVPAMGALLERERGVGEKMSGVYPLLVFVFFLIAFRETGGDFETYSDLFHLISRLDFFQSVAVTEPAYGGLNWISNQFDADIYGVNAVCAVIFLGGFAYFCAPERRPVLMLTVAMAYLIIVVVVGYTRQGTAIGIELIGLRMLMQRRIVPYFVCVLLAMTFHRSAMILLPFAYYALPKQTGRLAVSSPRRLSRERYMWSCCSPAPRTRNYTPTTSRAPATRRTAPWCEAL